MPEENLMSVILLRGNKILAGPGMYLGFLRQKLVIITNLL